MAMVVDGAVGDIRISTDPKFPDPYCMCRSLITSSVCVYIYMYTQAGLFIHQFMLLFGRSVTILYYCMRLLFWLLGSYITV